MKNHDDTNELDSAALCPETAARLHAVYAATIASAARILGGEWSAVDAEDRAWVLHDLQGALEWLEVEKQLLSDALACVERRPALRIVRSPV